VRLGLGIQQPGRGDAVKSRNWRLNSQQTIKQVFFITALGTQGISPPNVCTEETQLLDIYAYVNIHINYISKKCLS